MLTNDGYNDAAVKESDTGVIGAGMSVNGMDGSSKSESSDKEPQEAKRSMNALMLGFILFFLTAGGPFGVEGSAGALLTILGTTTIALVWAFPQAVLATELGLMMPANGGGFVWVHRGFGPMIGWINGWNNFASSFINIGLLVTLFPSYLPIDNLTFWERFGLSLFFCLVTIGINIVGFRWVSRLSAVILVVLFSPFFALLFWEIATGKIHSVDWAALKDIPSWDYVGPRMSTFVGTCVWAFGGFDSLGNIAGEISGGRRTFFLGLLITMPLLLCNYTFPLIMVVPLEPNITNWGFGGDSGVDLVSVLRNEAAPWLGVLAVVGAISATFAQLSSSIMAFARVIWASSRSTGRYKMFPSIVADLSWRRYTGTVRPIGSIFVAGVLSTLLTLLDFDLIVSLYLVSRIINLWLLYATLVRLRFSEPDTPRPFQIPGGVPFLVLLGIPTVIISIFAMAFASWQIWVISGVSEAVIVLAYFLRLLMLRHWPEPDVLFGEPPIKGVQEEAIVTESTPLIASLDTDASLTDEELSPELQPTSFYLTGAIRDGGEEGFILETSLDEQPLFQETE